MRSLCLHTINPYAEADLYAFTTLRTVNLYAGANLYAFTNPTRC